MILLIDNYDSFSYNLYQMIGTMNPDIAVIRNDEKCVEEIARMEPERIILSPGPGYPAGAGVCIDVVKMLGERFPILGVCLGHQAICEAFGARIAHAKRLMHGKQSVLRIDPSSVLFRGLGDAIPAARYHSLSAVEDTLPACLKVTARADDGEIMAVEHRRYPVFGLQFHPESILTPDGAKILENFISFGGQER